MADETVTTLANLLREQRGPLVENLRWSTVILSEIERGSDPEMFDGSKVKIPLILAPQQGTGFTTEQGTLNTPRPLDTSVVNVDSGIAHVTLSFTTKAKLAAKGDEQSWINLVPDKMRMAEEGLRRTINESFLGSGTALIAACTATNTNSTTVTVGTGANFYQLYSKRYCDFKTRANGVDVATTNGSGATGIGRQIVSTNAAAGTLVVDVAISTTAADGIYYEGSYGNAIQGLSQAAAATGTFQTVDKAANQFWQGTVASPAAANTNPTMGVMARAERLAAQNSGVTPDFYIGDPAVIDQYELTMAIQARWAGESGTLETGWEGIKYRNKVLVRDFDSPPNQLIGVRKEDVKIYTRDNGPDWDETDGSMFKRFARALPFECWLVWMLQLGFQRCVSQVLVGNLAQAA